MSLRSVLATLLSVAALGTGSAVAQTTTSQQVVTPGPGHFAALLPDRSVLVAGGDDANGVATTNAVLYATDGTPTSVGPMLTARSDATATQLKDGTVLVVGGYDATGAPLTSIEIFELAPPGQPGGTFRASKAVLNYARAVHEALALMDGRVLIRGGFDSSGNFVLVDEVYDPATDSVTAPADAGLEYGSIYTDKGDYFPGDTVYVSGGRWQPGENVELLFDEDPMPHAPQVITVTADENGQLHNVASLVVDQYDLGRAFTLHAVGATTAASADTYFTDDSNPSITSISPGSGITGGNTLVTIGGSGFISNPAGYTITTVTFGGTPGTNLSVLDASTLTVRAPAHAAAETVTVTIYRNDSPKQKTATTTFTYVADTTPPTFSNVPADMTVEATSSSGATVTFTTPTATDAVDGNRPVTCAPASGTTFPLGTTTVTCTASDTSGNTGSASFKVTVQDTTPPVIAAHLDVTAQATSGAGAVVNYMAPATSDAVDGPGTATCSPASGSTFALGSTTVTCNATDKAGNHATATTFKVTVQDTTPPVIAAHADVTAEATSAAGAAVSYTAPATSDAVDGAGTATCSPAPGSTFALGSTTVTCNATDAAGNHATATTFKVTVQDTTPPVIAAHLDVMAEATSGAGAVVSYTAPATSDAVDGAGMATCSPASGGTFALGSTTVTCNATDAAGNHATATTFKVIVQDTTPPVIAAHVDVTAEATSGAGAAVSYTAPATSDAVDGAGTATCSPASGSTFALGSTTVTCNATDKAGNHATVTTFKVTVQDTTPPVIAAHADVTAEATSGAGAGVSYTVPGTSDAVDGAGTATCSPASGSTFALGSTTVTCNATDKAGNHATATTFKVIVQDTTPPIIAAHLDVTAEATSAAGAAVSYTAPATSDAVDGAGTATCSPASGSTFALGSTTVTCNATDKAGNAATATTFKVIVQDTTPPVIAAHADVTAEANSGAGAVVTYTAPATSDAVDGAGTATCSPASGSTFALGSNTVTCNATDKAGNHATATTFKVSVLVSWSKILQPINLDGSSKFKLGRTIPVKFQLVNGSAAIGGALQGKATISVYFWSNGVLGTMLEDVSSTSAADTGTLFRYDATANQYIYNLATSYMNMATYAIVVDLGDGAKQSPVLISFTK